jgi:hypothetical protein
MIEHIFVLPLYDLPVRKELTLDFDIYIYRSIITPLAPIGYTHVALYTLSILFKATRHSRIYQFLTIFVFLAVFAKASPLITGCIFAVLTQFSHLCKGLALGAATSVVIHTQVSSHLKIDLIYGRIKKNNWSYQIQFSR